MVRFRFQRLFCNLIVNDVGEWTYGWLQMVSLRSVPPCEEFNVRSMLAFDQKTESTQRRCGGRRTLGAVPLRTSLMVRVEQAENS